jgi:hypothetical protein
MPSDNGATLTKGVSASFKQLAQAAADLNKYSDAVGSAIGRINDRLNGLRLGMDAWVLFDGVQDGALEENYFLGYCRLPGKNPAWGIAIRYQTSLPDGTIQEDEIKPFNEASREFRLKSINEFPTLIAELNKVIEAKASELAPVAALVKEFENSLETFEISDEDVPF